MPPQPAIPLVQCDHAVNRRSTMRSVLGQVRGGVWGVGRGGGIVASVADGGATISEPLHGELRPLQGDPHAVLSLGVAHATAQCVELLQRGAPGIHFYTLNKSPATRTILMAIRTIYPPARQPAGS
jgi:hypothetical protein